MFIVKDMGRDLYAASRAIAGSDLIATVTTEDPITIVTTEKSEEPGEEQQEKRMMTAVNKYIPKMYCLWPMCCVNVDHGRLVFTVKKSKPQRNVFLQQRIKNPLCF